MVDIKSELEEYGVTALVHDPLADPEEALDTYGFELTELQRMDALDALIFAVPHRAYAEWELESLKNRCASPENPILLDIKGMWDRNRALSLGFAYWRL